MDENLLTVSLNPIMDNIIPMGTAVVLKSSKSTIKLTRLVAAGNYDNDLVGTSSSILAPTNSYAFSKGSKGVGFYKCAEDTRIPAKHAYLIIHGDRTRNFLSINSGVEDITIVKSLEKPHTAPSVVYNLKGHKASAAYKSGIYIQDGRLVLKKYNY